MGTERFKRENQCTGKQRFVSKGEAKRNAARLVQLARHGLEPYSCPHCAMWHLGHRPPAEVIAIVREARARAVADGTDQ